MNKRSELLSMAEGLVNGDRNRQYGDPRSDFLRTATLWEAYLNGAHERHLQEEYTDGEIIVEPHDVAVLMLLLKISRLAWSPEKEDTWADIAGYAACGWDCVAEDDDDNSVTYTDEDIDNMTDEEIVSAYMANLLGRPVYVDLEDEVDQDDISLDEDEMDALDTFLRGLVVTKGTQTPKSGGFLGATLFRDKG